MKRSPSTTTTDLAAELPAGIQLIGSIVHVGPRARIDHPTVERLQQFVLGAGPAVAVCVVVGPDTPPPSPLVLGAMDKALFDPKRVLAVALVHEFGGLRGKMVRGVLAGVGAGRTKLGGPPIQVFDELKAAQAWLEQHARTESE